MDWQSFAGEVDEDGVYRGLRSAGCASAPSQVIDKRQMRMVAASATMHKHANQRAVRRAVSRYTQRV
jgi:hypothetical protein